MRIALGIIVSAAVFIQGCRTGESPRSAAGNPIDTIYAKILYLPSGETMEATIAGDSIAVERKDAGGGILNKTNALIEGRAAQYRDSLVSYLIHIRGGTYEKKMVLDGTRIWIRFRNNKIFCDNCLNEYVLEHIGAPSAPKSKKIRQIKEAVSYINQIAGAVEKKPEGKFKRIQVILNPPDSAHEDYKVKFMDKPAESK
jgi:hypothetical protein